MAFARSDEILKNVSRFGDLEDIFPGYPFKTKASLRGTKPEKEAMDLK